MRRNRVAVAVCAAFALVSGLLAGTAQARDAAVPYNANALSTWQADGIVWTLASSGNTVYAGGRFSNIRPPGVAAGGTGTQSAVNFAAFDASTGAPLSNCHLAFRS